MVEYTFKWRRLVCGSNGTGFSSLLNVEQPISSTSSSFRIIQSILINCGDSTQQICLQHKIKLHKLSCIIITSLTPCHISGLPGIILTLSNLGVERLKIIGPAGIKGYIACMNVFLFRNYPILEIVESGDYSYNDKLDRVKFQLIGMSLEVTPVWPTTVCYPLLIMSTCIFYLFKLFYVIIVASG